jgi:hypothetical protein
VRQDAPLDARDHRLIELMVTGHTQRQCAEQLRWHRATVSRRAKRPAFVTALAQAEAGVRRTARRKIAASLTTAADYLVRAVDDDKVPPAVRVAAAGRLLNTWAALEPRQLDVAATVAPAPRRRDGESFAEILERMASRLGIPDDVACPTEADIWRAEGRTPPPQTNGEEART